MFICLIGCVEETQSQEIFTEVKAACRIQAWYRCRKARKEYLAVLRKPAESFSVVSAINIAEKTCTVPAV